jgi:hypothetical protein
MSSPNFSAPRCCDESSRRQVGCGRVLDRPLQHFDRKGRRWFLKPSMTAMSSGDMRWGTSASSWASAHSRRCSFPDNQANDRSAPNENYARELLEPYVGVDGATPSGMMEMARCLTG